MADQYVEPITTATTSLVTVSKIGTVGGVGVAGVAEMFGERSIALFGLGFTILFGVLGLLVTYHFKNKEYVLKAKEDNRRDEEHAATMARLTEK